MCDARLQSDVDAEGFGQTNAIFYGIFVFMLVAILVVANPYFQLHAIPECLAHRSNVFQMELVAVLALLRHPHNLFGSPAFCWPMIRFSGFSTPTTMTAGSVEQLADHWAWPEERSA
jgi:hypothetical protein